MLRDKTDTDAVNYDLNHLIPLFALPSPGFGLSGIHIGQRIKLWERRLDTLSEEWQFTPFQSECQLSWIRFGAEYPAFAHSKTYVRAL